MSDLRLVDLWRSSAQTVDGMHLVDPEHPLELFYGRSENGLPRFVLRTSVKPVKPHLSEVVLVERYPYGEDGWVLSLTLQDLKFEEVFFKLTDDVHARTRKSATPAMALERAISVFEEWRRLMRPKTRAQLSLDELRGLVGELWLLLNHFADEMTVSAAVEGWLGPLGLPQDFHYPSAGYSEVKSIGPATVQVRISSEHQLDAQPLRLHVLTVPTVTESTPGAITLALLVSNIQNKLLASGDSSDPLEERLKRLGVDLNDSYYGEMWFLIERFATYNVGPDFPAVRASNLPNGVNRVSYQIELVTIQDHMIDLKGEN